LEFKYILRVTGYKITKNNLMFYINSKKISTFAENFKKEKNNK